MRMSISRRVTAAAFAVSMFAASIATGAVLAACSGHGKSAKVPDTEPDPKRALALRDGGAELGPHHFFLADVPDGSIGPHWARGEGGGLVAYIGPPEVDARAIVVMKVNKDGEGKDPAAAVATAKVDANAILVRPLSKGYFVGWTELTDKGEALRAVIVNADGKATGKAFEIGRTSNDIVWFEVKQTQTGALVVWAESTKDGLATIVAQPLDQEGAPAQVAVRVAQGAVGWQLVASNASGPSGKEGAVLFLTTPTLKGKGDVAVTMQRLGPDGQPLSAPLVVAPSARASGDVDAVRLSAAWLVAWTERGVGPSSVVTALVRDGAAGPEIAKLTDGVTASELVALGANGDDALVAWSEPSRKSRTLKNVYVAHASSKGVEGARVSALETSARGVDLVPAGAGFAMSCEVVSCGANGKPDAIGNQPTCDGLHPALVSLGKEGAMLGRSLFSIGTSEPGMAWDAQCDGTSCLALAAEAAGRVAHLHTVSAQVSVKPSSQEPVAAIVPLDKKPPTADAQTITEGQSVADVAVTKLGDSELVLVLKNSVDDVKKNGGAELSSRLVDKTGALSPAQVLSSRALPVGGVAVASGKKPEDGAVVAWAARENGFTQIHVTKVDKRGKKTNDALLTTTQADSSDVAIVRVPQGFLVSWVDNRNKNGEVYATIINGELQRVGREERITNAPGDATDVTLTPVGEDVLVAWADTRDSTEDGFADIYAALLSNHDAKKKGPEVRVLATAAHSRSPSTLLVGDKIAIAWIEDVPAGQDGAPATAAAGAQGAMLAFLDAKGAVTGSPARLPPSARGSAIAVTLGMGRVPSAVVARAGLDDVALDWFDLSREKPSAVPLGLLDGPPSMDVSLALGSDALYFSDEGPEAKDRRARRLRVNLP